MSIRAAEARFKKLWYTAATSNQVFVPSFNVVFDVSTIVQMKLLLDQKDIVIESLLVDVTENQIEVFNISDGILSLYYINIYIYYSIIVYHDLRNFIFLSNNNNVF